ncbi:thioredoxin-like protein [Usnea florida]
MVELRKRKAPADRAAVPPPPVKKANSVKSSNSSTKGLSSANGSASTGISVAVGDIITIEGFGGEIDTNDGEKVTLKKLLDESKSGVVLFTYPKASTPGCTTQACLFRDEFTPLTATGYAIYGLSTDSVKSNTNFKNKQNLPYGLLCDPSMTLIGAIGMRKSPSGTTRGVFVINKDGKVEAISPGVSLSCRSCHCELD